MGVGKIPTLIQYWKLARRQSGQQTEVMDFHHTIANKLTRLMLGTLGKPNLMVLMPPRCAKTDLCVKTFIPYAMDCFPDSEFITSSYGADLAIDNTMACRSILSSQWHNEIIDSEWGARVPMRGTMAGGRQDHFFTEQGGAIKGVGRGGGITGFGAGKLRPEFGGCIVVDDLLKANERTSPAARKEAYSYITATLKSRRNRLQDPPTPMVLVMQRLHPEDPAGMLLREERDQWDVLQIPAHDDKGVVIWPGRLDMPTLEMMMDTDPDTYWSQYMQEPTANARAIFKEVWWRYWRNLEEVERRCTLKFMTADTAFEEKTSADWSVISLWGCEGISGLYLLDQIRGQWDYPDLFKAAKGFWEKHSRHREFITPATEYWVENKASGISLVQTLRSHRIPARAWEPKDRTPKDKVGRAKHSTMPISAGRVFLPNPSMPGFEWVGKFVNEHTAFTDDDSHLNDDQVDAHTIASSIWQERGGGRGPLPSQDNL